MKFRSEIFPAFTDELKIKPTDKIILSGSCFSEEIGQKLYKGGWDALINPLGIQFHPYVHGKLILHTIDQTLPNEDFIIKRDDVFFSLFHHSSFYANSKEQLISNLKEQQQNLRKAIEQSDYLFFTFGTAFYFYHKKKEITVANCHKIPQGEFEKKISEPSEIINLYIDLKEKIKNLNPKAKILITVSPVRYLRHGIIDNTLSKSILLYAAHKLSSEHGYYYFPSYELVSEDLKDYRFYKEDLMHPNDMAVNYVWDKFSTSLMTSESLELKKRVNKIYTMLEHRFKEPVMKKEITMFYQKLNDEISSIISDYPHLNSRIEFRDILEKSKSQMN
jgi:hypothetical protein